MDIDIVINEENKKIPSNTSVTGLLKQLDLQDKIVAISLNLEVLKKQDWESTILQQNDRLEVLHFMGGGEC